MSTLTTAAHKHHTDVSPSDCTRLIAVTATTFTAPNHTMARYPDNNGGAQVASTYSTVAATARSPAPPYWMVWCTAWADTEPSMMASERYAAATAPSSTNTQRRRRRRPGGSTSMIAVGTSTGS